MTEQRETIHKIKDKNVQPPRNFVNHPTLPVGPLAWIVSGDNTISGRGNLNGHGVSTGNNANIG